MTIKTIRERKDELLATINQTKANIIANIESTKLARENAKNTVSQYVEYSNILRRNGIKNETLIKTQIERLIKAGIPRDAVYSNLKFLHLCRSRLTEEGFSLVDAESILTHVDFDMTGINEDDDYIGDVALAYADLAAVRLNQLKASLPSDSSVKLTPIDDILAESFASLPIKLPPQ